MLNITNIPAPRVPVIDPETGLMSREWYRFFLNVFVMTGSGSATVTLTDLQDGIDTTVTTANLVGRTITVTNGLVTSFI
jgi:hypothetical protein